VMRRWLLVRAVRGQIAIDETGVRTLRVARRIPPGSHVCRPSPYESPLSNSAFKVLSVVRMANAMSYSIGIASSIRLTG